MRHRKISERAFDEAADVIRNNNPLEIALYIHNKNIDINKSVNPHGYTFLTYFSYCEEIGMEALLRLGADPNLQDGKGRYPLALACEIGYVEDVSLLVDAKVSFDIRWGPSGGSALHNTLIARNAPLADYLISCGVDIHCADDDGYTPLLWAVGKDMPDIATLLLSKGADMSVTTCSDIHIHDLISRDKVYRWQDILPSHILDLCTQSHILWYS